MSGARHAKRPPTLDDDGAPLPEPIFTITQEQAERMAWAEAEQRATAGIINLEGDDHD